MMSGCGLTGDDDGDSQEGEQNGEAENGSPVETEEVIGEGTFPYYDNKGEVTFEINGFTERGDLLQMDYTVTPGTPESDARNDPTLRNLFDAGSGGNIHLLDTDNLRRHTVVEDESGTPLESDPWDTALPYDEPTTLTAFFASAEDMETVDVYLYEFPPIMDVPVNTEGGE
ncbi:hypothetical protein EFW17_02515 [Halostreptopolyspora alba]|uniref:DUF4352 domain-containing protein n=2 Tax=Halostreptopolyspora alba TaxID=2487137 RepID=A0A3N0EGI8_9ACTN|nr:hypothetical protein EFW17_02515 [Nocardiopsaceae bacterium YIM 96095]